MFCPQCGAEYRPGFDRCSECGVLLTAEPPPEEDHRAVEHGTVFETSDSALIPVIKSVLQSADIPFNTHGEVMTNLFPSQALGAVFSKHRGGVVSFRVPVDRLDEARQLLDEHETVVEPPAEPPEPD